MRIIKNIIVATLPLFLMVGCGNWLDVTPKAQVGLEKMFLSEQGFEDVLIGCYTSMTKKSMYGGELTYGAIDALAQYYDTESSSHVFNEMTRYIFTGEKAKSVIDNMWLDSYFTIANCNVLLDNLAKANKSLFVKGHDRFIEAEARAIRAYVHFDLLRVFAPSWLEGSDKYAIPYADVFKSTPFKQLKTEEVVDLIIKDLEIGRALLKDIDPVFEDTFKETIYHFTQPVDDGRSDFVNFRAYRMNYFAITATLARVYQYKGDKKKAFECAKEVIDNKSRFAFTPEGSLTGEYNLRDVNMKNEILFCLYHTSVYKTYNSYNLAASSACYIFEKDRIYPYADDFRKLYCLTQNTENKKHYSLKFIELKNGNGGKVPLLRISEMFFIAAESIYETDPDLACKLMNELRINRGVLVPLTPDVSYAEFKKELTLEFRSEFLGEGQLFYHFKRHGGNVLRGGSVIEMKASQYTLPLPATEVEFGDYKFD